MPFLCIKKISFKFKLYTFQLIQTEVLQIKRVFIG